MRSVAAAVVLIAMLGVAGCGDDEPAPPAVEVPEWAKVAAEQIAEAKKHGVPVAFENDLGMRFVLIPAGSFLMGSPEDEEGRSDDETQHEVTISRPFYLATTETTRAVWDAVMFVPDEGEVELFPQASVTWKKCHEFLTKLNGAVTGGGYRLPTEAEWEYACRAGTTTRYWSGDDEADLARVGWYVANSDRRLHVVGKKPANRWGLHDMHGNVIEWCQDSFEPYEAAAVTDPVVRSRRWPVCRGGSLWDAAQYVRSAARFPCVPENLGFGLGFRLVKSIPTK